MPPALLATRFLEAVARLARRGQADEPVAPSGNVVDQNELARVVVGAPASSNEFAGRLCGKPACDIRPTRGDDAARRDLKREK